MSVESTEWSARSRGWVARPAGHRGARSGPGPSPIARDETRCDQGPWNRDDEQATMSARVTEARKLPGSIGDDRRRCHGDPVVHGQTRQSTMPEVTIPGMAPTISRSESWQEMERALSLVHVAGLELIAEIKAEGEQSGSATSQEFDDALAVFHDALGRLELLPRHLRSDRR